MGQPEDLLGVEKKSLHRDEGWTYKTLTSPGMSQGGPVSARPEQFTRREPFGSIEMAHREMASSHPDKDVSYSPE
jgi:hypothetical protein